MTEQLMLQLLTLLHRYHKSRKPSFYTPQSLRSVDDRCTKGPQQEKDVRHTGIQSEEKNEGEDEEGGDEDKDETVKVKIAVDSFDALKEYLEGKGFNLEEELGGEIVSDDSEDSEGDDEDDKKDQEELDTEFDGFDDLFK